MLGTVGKSDWGLPFADLAWWWACASEGTTMGSGSQEMAGDRAGSRNGGAIVHPLIMPEAL
jgi:hypothetical protein